LLTRLELLQLVHSKDAISCLTLLLLTRLEALQLVHGKDACAQGLEGAVHHMLNQSLCIYCQALICSATL